MTVQVTLTFASAAAAAALLSTVAGMSGNAQTTVSATPTPAPTPTTRFFFQASHNNLYSVAPGQPVPNIPDAVEINESKFNEIKATLAAQFAASQVAAAHSSVSAPSPAPAAAGAIDPFGGDAAPAGATPMTSQQFFDGLKAKCSSAEARTKLAAFLKTKNVQTIPMLVAGKSDAELGALFVEASAAVA